MGRQITLTDVARELGVSPTTVSNAYNRPDQLSSALRDRILEAAQRLGYAGPDPTARGLRRGRTGAVGVIYDSRLAYAFQDPAAVGFMAGLSTVAEREQLGLLLVPGASLTERDANVVSQAMVDGFVVYSVAEADPLVRTALRRSLPLVIVDQPRSEKAAFVGIDDTAGAAAAATHLADLGHRRIGVVAFGLARDGRKGFVDQDRQRTATYPVTRARLDGYAAALAAGGIDWSDVAVFECPGSSRQLGREAAGALLSLDPRPTAVLATSDQLALGVMAAAQQEGMLVPDDLSIVGFDDVADAARDEPPLTTVSQDHTEKGRAAGRLLLTQLGGESLPDYVTLDSHLTVRRSTGPPPPLYRNSND